MTDEKPITKDRSGKRHYSEKERERRRKERRRRALLLHPELKFKE